MIRPLLFGLFSVIIPFVACADKMEGEDLMLMKFSNTIYNLGETVPAEIQYRNNTSAQIKMENPAKSFEIIMHVFDSTNSEELNYTMGKIQVTVMDKAADQYSKSIPPKEMVTIEADSSLNFVSDLNDRLYLHPGSFTCWVAEGDSVSNKVTIVVRFMRESVPPLTQTLRDVDASYGRREWAMGLLQKIYPRLKLDLPYDEDSPAVRKEKESKISAMVAEFINWWHDNQNSDKIEMLIQSANKGK